jgi:hypothetical protein
MRGGEAATGHEALEQFRSTQPGQFTQKGDSLLVREWVFRCRVDSACRKHRHLDNHQRTPCNACIRHSPVRGRASGC